MTIPIHRFETVGSVMLKAEELTNMNSSLFAVVSEQMTAGEGRFNKPWHATCKDNLHLAISLPRSNTNLDTLKRANIWFGIEVCRKLQELFPKLDFKVKWPNDIYCNGKKVSGMFAKSRSSIHGEAESFILGLGLNINTELKIFPEKYRSVATSLYIESGSKQDKESITTTVINAVHSGLKKTILSTENIIDEFNNFDYVKGKELIGFDCAISTSRGVGINNDGTYNIILDNGEVKVLTSSDIVLKGEENLIDILKETGCHFFLSS